MPPSAEAVVQQSGPASNPSAPEKAKPAQGTPVGSGDSKPDSAQTAQGGDPTGKQSMSKDEESTAMPKPGQANDHSTTATDGKQ